MPKILVDRHHSSLLTSLIMLFEDRLGYELYVQVGMDWFTDGFWKINDLQETANQYLNLDQSYKPIDGTDPLNQISTLKDKVIILNNIDDRNLPIKAITLETFKEMQFDILLASVPQHLPIMEELKRLYQPNAKIIMQVGNVWNFDQFKANNILASANLGDTPYPVNLVRYHQEFCLKTFKPSNNFNPSKNITSFVNCFSKDDLFSKDWNLFTEVESIMPEWKFKSLGGQCRDGAAHGIRQLINELDNTRFIWHTKNGGDGYGHIIHQSFCVGRPPIVKEEYYVGKLAGDLMADGVTCITIDGLSTQEIKNKIEYYSEPKRYKTMSINAANMFKEKVDFDKEEILIRNFINSLI